MRRRRKSRKMRRRVRDLERGGERSSLQAREPAGRLENGLLGFARSSIPPGSFMDC
jgi:hypothetical protein